MNRVLRHVRDNHRALSNNLQHMTAANQALVHYKSNSVYSFIPKNNCTAMRYALARANGCITGPDEFNWVHNNNRTFVASLRELATATNTFVILRCPYTKIASVFLDKVVGQQPQTRILLKTIGLDFDLGSLTFRNFCKMMRMPIFRNNEIHWQRQCDLLVYEEYDSWYCLETFDEAKTAIEACTGLEIDDTRSMSAHDHGRFELVDSCDYADWPARDLEALHRSGASPAYTALYDEQIASIVKLAYAPDIELYKQKFGASNLMFC